MVAANWNASLAIILKEEGGNDDDKDDPGGRTSRGITQKEWNVYRESHPNLPSDVWKAPDDAVNDIYHMQYWNPYCDRLPSGVDLIFFNTSVNSGRSRATKELQRALNVNADGMMGMITFNALQSCQNIPALISNMCEQRRNFYRALKTFWKYGKGWLARTDRVEKSALAMAASIQPVLVAADHPLVDTLPPQPEITVSAKADVDDVSQPPMSQESGTGITVGTTVASGALQQIQSTTEMLQPFSETLNIVKYILIGLALISLGLTLYAIWHNHKNKEAIG